jgi:hypothetical protein
MNGPNTSTTFTDSAIGGKGHIWTAHPSAQISTAQSKFLGSSGSFDGTSGYISTPYSTDFYFGSGNFTFDFWMYIPTLSFTSPSEMTIASTGMYNVSTYGGWEIGVVYHSAGVYWLIFDVYNGSGSAASPNGYEMYNSTSLSAAAWTHVAIVRSGSNGYIFLNGNAGNTVVETAPNGTMVNNNEPCWIGKNVLGTRTLFSGYLQEFRVSNIARWTSTFTPPASEYMPAGGGFFGADF